MEDRVKYVHNQDIEYNRKMDFSDEVVMFAYTMERHYIQLEYYDCTIQELFWEAVKKIWDKASKNEIEDAVKKYLDAKAISDNAAMLEDIKSGNLPQINSRLPGFRYPTEKQLIRGINNPYAPNSDNDSLDWLNFLKNLFCGDLDHLFDLGRFGKLNLPNFNLPNFNLGADININVDQCLGKFLPDIFNTKNNIGVFSLNGNKFSLFGKDFSGLGKLGDSLGKLGDMANKALGALNEGVDAINGAIDSVNKAIGVVEGTIGEAINGVVGSVKGALNTVLGSVMGSGALGGLKGALSSLGKAIGPIVSAIATVGQYALGTLGFLNGVRDSLGNNIAGNLRTLYDARRKIQSTLDYLKYHDMNGKALDVNSNEYRQREQLKYYLEDAKQKIDKGLFKLGQVQDFLDDVNERSYHYETDSDGFRYRVYDKKVQDLDDNEKIHYNIHTEIGTNNSRELFCGVPRLGNDKFSRYINKLQKHPGFGNITENTTAKDAQLRRLEYLDAMKERYRLMEKKRINQGCEVCNDDKNYPTEEEYKKDNFREELIDNIKEKIKDDLIDDGVNSIIADKIAEEEANNDTVVDIYDDGGFKDKDYDWEKIKDDDIDETHKKIVDDLIDKNKLCPVVRDIPTETVDEVIVFLQAVSEICFHKKNVCLAKANYKKLTEPKKEIPNKVEDYTRELGHISPTENNTNWYLYKYHIKENIRGVYYYVDYYLKDVKDIVYDENHSLDYYRKITDVLEYRFRIIDGNFIINNFEDKLMGLSEEAAQLKASEIASNFVDLWIFKNNHFINHLSWSSRCDMNNDINTNTKIDIKDIYEVLKDDKTKLISDDFYNITKDEDIIVDNKLTGDTEKLLIPKEITEKDDIIVDDNNENIFKGSQICDEVIVWLIENSEIIKNIIKEKGLDKDSLNTYEYIRYIVLPNSDNLYKKAMEVCQTGKFEDFDMTVGYIKIVDTEDVEIRQVQIPEQKVEDITYKGKKADVILPKRVIDRIPKEVLLGGSRINKDEAIYVEVKLSNDNLDTHYESINLYNDGAIKYFATITKSDEDTLYVKAGNKTIYKKSLGTVMYSANGKTVVEVV